MKVYAKKNFKETRIKKGFNTVGLSKEINLTKQMIAQVERRANGISPEKAVLIATVLNVGFDEIFELVERNK